MNAAKDKRDFDIQTVIDKLDNGEMRLVDSDVNLSVAWFPTTRTEIEEELEELLGPSEITGRVSVLEKVRLSEAEEQFMEETRAIEERLKECGVSPPTCSDPPDIWGQLDFRALVLRIWKWYAIPLRVRDGWVHRIGANMLTGEPIIESLPVPLFVSLAAQKTAQDIVELRKIRGKYFTCRRVAITLGVCVFTLVVVHFKLWWLVW